MSTVSRRSFGAAVAVAALAFTPVALAQNPMRGPLPQEQRALIDYMAEHHDELKREIRVTKKGYEASTTTANKELAQKLKAHFRYMHKRLGSGAMVRRWDPAFVELVEYYDEIETEFKELENGIRVVVTGTTPAAIKVAQNHGRIVSGFVKHGSDAVHREHEVALGKKAKPTEPKTEAADKPRRQGGRFWDR